MSIASAVERTMLGLVNAERSANGLAPLTLELRLNDAAEDHSRWMLATGSFGHDGAGGSRPTDRMRESGFDLSGSWGTAENVALRTVGGAPGLADDVAALHEGLMASPGHRGNILNGDYDVVGIGIETGSFTYSGGITMHSVAVTQNFAYTGGRVTLDAPGRTPAPEPAAPAAPTPEPEAVQPSAAPTRGDDVLAGSRADDFIDAGAGSDRVAGGAGDDLLMGGDGRDTLIGGTGADTLVGGDGSDVYQGGAGADVFAFSRRAGGAPDVVADFNRGEDMIWLDADLIGVREGRLDLSYTELGRSAREGDTRLLYDPGSGQVRIDDDGAGGAAARLLFTFDDGDRPLVSDVLLG